MGKLFVNFTTTQRSAPVTSIVRSCSYKEKSEHSCDLNPKKIVSQCRICKKWFCKNSFKKEKNSCLKCFRYNEIIKASFKQKSTNTLYNQAILKEAGNEY